MTAVLMLASGCSPTTNPDSTWLSTGEENAGNDNSSVVLGTIDMDEARTIAERFVVLNLPSLEEWKDAMLISSAHTFVDNSGDAVLYEFPVFAENGLPSGSVSIGAKPGVGVIASFSSEGESFATSLWNAAALVVPESTLSNGWLVAESPLIRAVMIPTESIVEGAALYDETNGVAIVGNLSEFSSIDTDSWPMYVLDAAPNSLSAEAELRERFLTASDEKLKEYYVTEAPEGDSGEHGVSMATGNVGSSSSYSTWYQQDRSWTSGSCNTGCSPVAMGILLEYWDRNGYSSILSGSSNSDPTTSTVQTMLDALRQAMGTTCSGSSGSTTRTNVDNGGDAYMDSKGYSWTFSQSQVSSTSTTSTVFSSLMSEINNSRPAVFHYTTSSGGEHAAVAWYYGDSSGTSSDFVCVRTGWQTTTGQCVNPHSSSTAFWGITKVRP